MSGESELGQERRAAPRAGIAAKIELRDRVEFFFTRDISSVGMFLLCNPDLVSDDLLQISIAVPEVRQLIQTEGRVVRRVFGEGQQGVGVEFINMPDEMRLLLDDAVAKVLHGHNGTHEPV